MGNGHRWIAAASPVIKGSNLADLLALTPHLAWAVGSHSPRAGANSHIPMITTVATG
jgi:hypothetical protein